MADYPSTEAMMSAVELEIHAALGSVQTVVIGQMIQKAIDGTIERLANENEVLRAVLLNPDPDSEPDNVRLHREKCDALEKLSAVQRENEAMRKALEEIVAAIPANVGGTQGAIRKRALASIKELAKP